MTRPAPKFIHVPFDQRDLAKSLGATWDPAARMWTCPDGTDLATVFGWLKQGGAP